MARKQAENRSAGDTDVHCKEAPVERRPSPGPATSGRVRDAAGRGGSSDSATDGEREARDMDVDQKSWLRTDLESRRALQLDALAAILPMDRRDHLAPRPGAPCPGPRTKVRS